MFKTRLKSVVKLPNFARCQLDASSAARLTLVAKPLYNMTNTRPTTVDTLNGPQNVV